MKSSQDNQVCASKLCQHLKETVVDCIEELCGGHATPAWKAAMLTLASSTVSLTCSKDSDSLEGKPWDVEVRTAVSYFHRFKDATVNTLCIESDLGSIRTIHSPQKFARLLMLSLEQSTRDLGYSLDIRCNNAGIICITTQARFLALRESGRLPCPHCCQWLRGDKGLWWHIQQTHAQNHSEAMGTTASTVMTNAIVVYDANNAVIGAVQVAAKETFVPRRLSSPVDPVNIAKQGNILQMKVMIEEGFSPSTFIDNKGASLLLWAAGSGRLDMVKFFIATCNCDPNFAQRGRRGFRGRTALHWAARNGHLHVVQYLVEECRVNLEAVTADGTTAFCWAAWQGHLGVMVYLHERKCNVSSVNSFGCNAALWAAQGSHGSPDIMRWLDSVGCSCLVLNDNHHGLLHKAAQRGKRELCHWFFGDMLVGLNAALLTLEMIRPDKEGCMPSDLAGMEGHESLAEYLASQERAITKWLLSSKSLALPSWLVQMSPSVACHIWEPFAGVDRLRCTAESTRIA
ncbi:hypothetical protein MPSEU_000496800 [Mayamaea pseudoterrestris]|nr:hypothetical protein MPSEU_000496800 [Mayamaea pseudoterrestris]